MSYYQRHVFFCLNQRTNGEASCGDHDAQGAFDHCKSRVKQLGLAGKGVSFAGLSGGTASGLSSSIAGRSLSDASPKT